MTEEATTIYLTDEELKQEIQDITEETGMSQSQFFREAAREYIEEKNKEDRRVDDLEERVAKIESKLSEPWYTRLL